MNSQITHIHCNIYTFIHYIYLIWNPVVLYLNQQKMHPNDSFQSLIQITKVIYSLDTLDYTDVFHLLCDSCRGKLYYLASQKFHQMLIAMKACL